MARHAYTFEIATNAPKGIWKVVDRTFWDRRLTMGEKRRAWSEPTDPDILAAALTVLKVEGADITGEWVAENLSEQDVLMAFVYIEGGEAGVTKYLAQNG